MMTIKSISVLVTLLLFFLLAFSQAQEIIKVHVIGMDCARCAARLGKNLQKLENVDSVAVDLKSGMATVMTKKNAVLADKVIRDAVEEDGFTVKSIVREKTIEKEKPNMQTVNLKISGMICTGCVETIKASLEEISAVKKIDINLKTGRAVVQFNRDNVDSNRLVDVIQKAGRFKVNIEN